MSPTTERLFILWDEWCWILLCLYLLHQWTERMGIDELNKPERKTWKRAFFTVLIVGAVMVYGVGYPSLWGWWRP